MSKYGHLDKSELLRLLERRDAERQLGLVWERDEIETDAAINDDFVALSLDESLSFSASATGDRGPGTGDRGPGTGDRGPGTGDRGPGTGDRGPGYFDAHFEGFGNIIIEGDNFDALRALRLSHKGAIRCIYIDPPYNTGNRDFVYNDHFVDKTHRFRHSLWLEFMYRRLLLAKELLADDGVIFVSIDDNELFRLGMLMDRVFGEDNFIANVIWQKMDSPKNTAQHFSDDHEYVVVYARDKSEWRPRRLRRSAEMNARYKNHDDDPRGPWLLSDLAARNYYSLGTYPIETPSGRIISGPPTGNYWRVSKEKFDELDRDNRVWWGKSGSNRPGIKRFLSEVRDGVVPQTLWQWKEVGSTRHSKQELNAVMGKTDETLFFGTPKPVQLMERILRIATRPDDTVLDFFAGSGTLAHAVAKLNVEDGGTRKFILVSSTEATEDDPEKNLCRDVCAERVRRVLGGYTNSKGEAVPGLGGNFAYLRARRVPRHRLAQKLEHAEVWCALQLLHARALVVWTGQGFAADGPLAYLADFHAAHVQRLYDWLATRDEQDSTLYSWSPARVTVLVGERLGLRCLPIPQHLRDRFGR